MINTNIVVLVLETAFSLKEWKEDLKELFEKKIWLAT